MIEGMLLVNKPSGPTSHDAVQTVRRRLGIRRVGHTGTLDPMAEGLLILLIGSATRHQQALQGHDKLYEATMQLGTQTDTGDALGAAVRTAPVPPIDRGHVAALLASLQGPMTQVPPAYSAVKVQGRPAYWWARSRRPVRLSARQVRLFECALVDADPSSVTFRVHCSAGTYVRTLAEEIAQRLGTVGHLTRLLRLRIGRWTLDEAHPLAWIEQAGPEAIARCMRLVPPEAPPP